MSRLQIPYNEYIVSQSWDKKRRKAIKRSGARCMLCNAGNTILHVHHRTYENLGHEHMKDLVVLCEKCHAHFHARLSVVPGLPLRMRRPDK